ncbi:hypothetical protein F4780DRAFT_795402 [Xylariomycetidae sp. FL0641]|nr:hypothetical protein F4780DRAFT_795402 [Xylariomycetidae sp. FL0641]
MCRHQDNETRRAGYGVASLSAVWHAGETMVKSALNRLTLLWYRPGARTTPVESTCVKVLELGFIGTAAILATLKTVGLWFLHDSVRRLVPCLLEVGALLVEVLNWRTTAIAVILGLAAVPCVGYMLYLRATPFFNTTAEDDEYDHGRANHHNYEKRKNKQRDAPKPGKSWRRDQSKRENPRKHPNRREDIEKAREATLSNAFEAWLDEIHVLMGDRARIRNLPPRAPPAASCSSDFCKQRKAEKNVTFCAHSIQQLVDAYVSTKRLTPEQRRQMLRKQVIMWHPDRFAACSADVRPRIQEVAMELMKVMRQVQDGDVCEVRS